MLRDAAELPRPPAGPEKTHHSSSNRCLPSNLITLSKVKFIVTCMKTGEIKNPAAPQSFTFSFISHFSLKFDSETHIWIQRHGPGPRPPPTFWPKCQYLMRKVPQQNTKAQCQQKLTEAKLTTKQKQQHKSHGRFTLARR